MGGIVVLVIVFGRRARAPLAPYGRDDARPDDALARAELAPLLRHRPARPGLLQPHALRRPDHGEDGLLVAFIATALGIIVGAVAGYYGGWIDQLLMRVTDLFLVVPALAVLLVAARFSGTAPPCASRSSSASSSGRTSRASCAAATCR